MPFYDKLAGASNQLIVNKKIGNQYVLAYTNVIFPAPIALPSAIEYIRVFSVPLNEKKFKVKQVYFYSKPAWLYTGAGGGITLAHGKKWPQLLNVNDLVIGITGSAFNAELTGAGTLFDTVVIPQVDANTENNFIAFRYRTDAEPFSLKLDQPVVSNLQQNFLTVAYTDNYNLANDQADTEAAILAVALTDDPAAVSVALAFIQISIQVIIEVL